jgi:CRP-like cAMP-binding protein
MIDKLDNIINDEKEVAVLKKGSGFGEGALLNDKPRAASIRCKTDCYFAILNRKDYAESIGHL